MLGLTLKNELLHDPTVVFLILSTAFLDAHEQLVPQELKPTIPGLKMEKGQAMVKTFPPPDSWGKHKLCHMQSFAFNMF